MVFGVGHFVRLACERDILSRQKGWKYLSSAVLGGAPGGCLPARRGLSPPSPALAVANRHGRCQASNARGLAVGCSEACAHARFSARCVGRAMGGRWVGVGWAMSAALAPEGGALTGASGGSFRTAVRRTGRGIRRQSAAGARNPIWRRCRGSASRHHPDRAVRAGHRSDAASAGTGRG